MASDKGSDDRADRADRAGSAGRADRADPDATLARDDGGDEGADAVAPPRPPLPWIIAGVAVVVVLAVAGWALRQQGQEAALVRALNEAHAALDAGRVDTASAAVEGLIDADRSERPDVAWVLARLAAARGDAQLALAAFDRAAKGAGDWSLAAQAALATHHVAALLAGGRAELAVQRAEAVLGGDIGPLDDYLDRDDLGDDGRPRPGAVPADAAALRLLELLRARVRAGLARADALDAGGDAAAAGDALDEAAARVSATICSGTHRLYCRAPRSGLRDLLVEPIARRRLQRRVRSALARVAAGDVDEAVEVSDEALQSARKASADAKASGGRPGEIAAARRQLEEAELVAYRVRVAAGAAAERAQRWADALAHYEAAEALWRAIGVERQQAAAAADDGAPGLERRGLARPQASGPGTQPQHAATPAPLPPNATAVGAAADRSGDAGIGVQPAPAAGVVPPHRRGLGRARALAKLLDDSDAAIDRLEVLGLGDADRRRFHDRLQRSPLDARVYVEEALLRVRQSHDPNRSADERAAAAKAARALLEAAGRVLPDDAMVRFYRGVVDVIDGRAAAGVAAMQGAFRGGYRDRAAALHLAEALSAMGRRAEASARWREAYALDADDAATARRAVEADVELGRVDAAAALAAKLRDDHGEDVEVLVADALVAIARRDAGAYNAARLGLDARVGTSLPPSVHRGRRVSAALLARERARVDGALRPGEVVLETVFGHAVAADERGRLLGEKVQCAVLIVTEQRLLVLRWDARPDRRTQVKDGVDVVRRTVWLGGRIGRELGRLHLDGLGDLVGVLRWLPEGVRAADKRPSLVEEGAELAVATMALIDAVSGDIALGAALGAARVVEVDAGALTAWSLVGMRGEADRGDGAGPGLWLLRARRGDGQSAWATDGDHLIVHHDRAELLIALLRARLGPPAATP